MKTLLSKTAIINVLLVTNVASAAFIVKEKGWLKYRLQVVKTETQAKGDAPKRRGSVVPSQFKNNNEIQACYEALLRREPDIDEGTLLVHMKVDKEGTIDSLNLVESDLADEAFTECVMENIKASRLPASEERAGVLIAHRFNFQRKTESRIDFAQ